MRSGLKKVRPGSPWPLSCSEAARALWSVVGPSCLLLYGASLLWNLCGFNPPHSVIEDAAQGKEKYLAGAFGSYLSPCSATGIRRSLVVAAVAAVLHRRARRNRAHGHRGHCAHRASRRNTSQNTRLRCDRRLLLLRGCSCTEIPAFELDGGIAVGMVQTSMFLITSPSSGRHLKQHSLTQSPWPSWTPCPARYY